MSKDLDEYPALKKELKDKKTKTVKLAYVDEDDAKAIEEELAKKKKEQEASKEYRYAGYDPGAIDFIRRCDTKEEALEIIDFLEKKGDITPDRAKELRKQLQKEGLRSFGEKKDKGFYLKKI
jgi:hypothetical protein